MLRLSLSQAFFTSARPWFRPAPQVACAASRSLAAYPAVQDYMPRPKALLLDAAGTLISPSEPAAEVLDSPFSLLLGFDISGPTSTVLPVGLPSFCQQIRLQAIRS